MCVLCICLCLWVCGCSRGCHDSYRGVLVFNCSRLAHAGPEQPTWTGPPVARPAAYVCSHRLLVWLFAPAACMVARAGCLFALHASVQQCRRCNFFRSDITFCFILGTELSRKLSYTPRSQQTSAAPATTHACSLRWLRSISITLTTRAPLSSPSRRSSR